MAQVRTLEDPVTVFDAVTGPFVYKYQTLGSLKEIDRSPFLALIDWRHADSRAVLLTIIAIEGRSPRSVGAQMAVNEHGDIYGYLTGGCLEGELARMAIEVIEGASNRIERYGRGSRFIDMRLPCGSGIDVLFNTSISPDVLAKAKRAFQERKPFALVTSLDSGHSRVENLRNGDTRLSQLCAGQFSRVFLPPIRTRLFGAGFAMLQLAHMLLDIGQMVEVFSNDAPTFAAASAMAIPIVELSRDTIRQLPLGDPWTASVVMFHEHSCEPELLEQLLRSESFYIGAVGSRSVNKVRVQTLRARGLERSMIERMIAPAGLITGARTATEMACGIMAEILARARVLGLTN